MNQREFIEFIRAIDAASAGAPSVEQWASVRRELAQLTRLKDLAEAEDAWRGAWAMIRENGPAVMPPEV